MTVMDRIYSLYATTRVLRPSMAWEWRLSRDVAVYVVSRYRPGERVDHIREMLGWPVVIMDDATPGTVGLVA